jgi:hypothetical protein
MGWRFGIESGKHLPLATCFAALVLAGCGDRGGGDPNSALRASAHAPMPLGADAGKRQDTGGALAQSFDVARDHVGVPASGVLLPPVMHSANSASPTSPSIFFHPCFSLSFSVFGSTRRRLRIIRRRPVLLLSETYRT